MKAVRRIDFAGGFDNYILRTPDEKLVSRAAIDLKNHMNKVIEMKAKGDKTLEEIKEELKPKEVNKHVWIPREYKTRFYYDWKGPRKQMIYC